MTVDRPTPSVTPEAAAWLARELAFLDDVERRNRRRSGLSRRARAAAIALAAAALCGGAWMLLHSRALRG